MRTQETNPADWYALAAERLRSADTLRRVEGITYSCVELLQESVERYLRGYLVSQGWKLERIHDLNRLVDAAAAYDRRFDQFTPLAQSLTEQFWDQHYPGGDLTEVGTDYDGLREQVESLVALLQAASQPPAATS